LLVAKSRAYRGRWRDHCKGIGIDGDYYGGGIKFVGRVDEIAEGELRTMRADCFWPSAPTGTTSRGKAGTFFI